MTSSELTSNETLKWSWWIHYAGAIKTVFYSSEFVDRKSMRGEAIGVFDNTPDTTNYRFKE